MPKKRVSVCTAHNDLAKAAFEIEAQDGMEMQKQEMYVGDGWSCGHVLKDF